jgi:hypothetical protein
MPWNDCIADCNGEWGGSLLNICFGYSFENWEVANQENCESSDGFWSPIGFDECGVCGGEGIPVEYCDCFGNVLDECDVCGGEGIPVEYCDCFGNVLDECGICDGDGSVFGDSPYCCEAEVDECGVCNGPDDIYECGCTGLPDGFCDCDGYIAIDCSGVCGGSAEIDECGICGGDSSTCMDCFGILIGSTQYDCSYDPSLEPTDPINEAACGGTARYDCRYGDDGYDQSENAVQDYCDGAFIDGGYSEECYTYNNNGQWISNDFTEEECVSECSGESGCELIDNVDGCRDDADSIACEWTSYLFDDAGLDECGICSVPGTTSAVYGNTDNCCELDVGDCGYCVYNDDYAVIYGETGPKLEDSGDCAGDVGCESFDDDNANCTSIDDGICVIIIKTFTAYITSTIS